MTSLSRLPNLLDSLDHESPVSDRCSVGSSAESPDDLLLHRSSGSTICSMTPRLYLAIASCAAALGGVLFGYDIGIISGALLQLSDRFSLSCFSKELLVSAVLIGALGASFIGGFIVDMIGRRYTMIANSAVFVIGAIMLTFTSNYTLLIVGRLIVGFGVSLSTISECLYISEIAPPKQRGLLVSLNEVGITIGFLLAYLANFLLIDVNNGWRYMFGLSAIPAVIQGVVMLFLPSSPRYLVLKDKIKDARTCLYKLRGGHYVETELDEIRSAVSQEREHSFTELFTTKDHMSYRMLIATVLVFFQQMTGQPSVLYYAPTIFQTTGFTSNTTSTLATVGLGTIKVLATLVTLLLIDRFGRRKFLIAGTTLMCVAVLVMGLIALQWPVSIADDCHTVHSMHSTHNIMVTSLTNHTTTSTTSANHSLSLLASNGSHIDSTAPAASQSVSKWFSFIALLMFITGYSIGFGPVTWLILSEIFPVTLKGRAFAIATIMNWSANLVISFTFLDAMKSFGVGAMLLFYSAMSLLAAVFTYFCIPETKGRSLESISALLKQGHTLRQTLTSHNCAGVMGCCPLIRALVTNVDYSSGDILTGTADLTHDYRPVSLSSRNTSTSSLGLPHSHSNTMLEAGEGLGGGGGGGEDDRLDSDGWFEEDEMSVDLSNTTTVFSYV